MLVPNIFKGVNMERVKLNPKNEIIHVMFYGNDSTIPLCPKCFSVWKYKNWDSSYKDWIRRATRLKKLDDIIDCLCGCQLSAREIIYNSILIDELIAKSISRINKAGYTTMFCCSGHIEGPPGYVNFKYLYNNLIDFILQNDNLFSLIGIDITIRSKKHKDENIYSVYKWNRKIKTYVNIQTIDYNKLHREPIPHMTIRMTRPKGKYSRLECMLLFRKMLNKIAKWCEENKIEIKDK